VFSSQDPVGESRPRERGTRQERQQQFRDATRRAILDAALDLFVVDGYASVSIRSIAAKVEYSPAAIYSYFPSKDDIFFALAEEGLSLLGHQELSAEPTSDPLDDVRAMLWRLYSFSKEQPQYFALVFLDRNVPRISQEYQRFAFMSELRDKTMTRMQRCLDTGALPSALHIDTAIRLLFAPVIGLAGLRMSKRLAPWEDPDALVRQSIDITLAGFHRCPPVGIDPPTGLLDSPCHSGR
jgi:AcrR family transcriptional regulator